MGSIDDGKPFVVPDSLVMVSLRRSNERISRLSMDDRRKKNRCGKKLSSFALTVATKRMDGSIHHREGLSRGHQLSVCEGEKKMNIHAQGFTDGPGTVHFMAR